MTWEIREGDCVELMRAMPGASVDSIVCDPPYALGFMGKAWDTIGDTGRGARARQQRAAEVTPAGEGHSTSGGPYLAAGVDSLRSAGRPFQAWCEAWAREAYRVLKPGGYLLAFGGTRTYHRMAAGVEDAGFEIRDQLQWLYGSGFPKSLDVEKAGGGEQWAGWGTALKPAHEPIVMARKPLVGTVAGNVLAYGTGAINVDGCRIGFRDDADEAESKTKNRHADFGSGARENRVYGADARARGENGNYDPEGRWPANVLLDETAAALLDEQTGELAAGNHQAIRQGIGYTATSGGTNSGTNGDRRGTEAGGASRFLYVAKASTAERNAGLDGFEARQAGVGDERPAGSSWERRAPEKNPNAPRANVHPTVKPIAVMRWLVRLVTPPRGVALDPFTGSGTTGIAATLEGFEFVGLERQGAAWREAHPDDDDYIAIAEARIRWWQLHPEGMELVKALEADKVRRVVADSGQLGMFGA